MGKLVFFAVFLAALAAASVAQDLSEQAFRDAECRREVLQSPLYACRQVVDRQLTGRARVGADVARFQWGARARCCQQLQDVSRECRCAAIRRMVRNYEQTMPALEEGYGGAAWRSQGQKEQGYYGETAEQAGQGYYGEAAGRQQQGQEGYHGETTEQEGQGYYGEAAGRDQQTAWRQEGTEGYYGEAAGRQQGEEGYGGETTTAEPPRLARVRLTKARQYVARLPNMCQLEPQECSVFSYDRS